MDTDEAVPARGTGEASTTSEFAWADRLLQPVRPPAIVYLDLNHWIGLAKAATNHHDSQRYAPLLRCSRDAVKAGRVRFVLSDTIYAEMANISDPRQRQDLANVMEELTYFGTLIARPVVMRLELEAALDRLGGPVAAQYEAISVIGKGVLQAFGRQGGLHVFDGAGADVTGDVRNENGHDEFDSWVDAAELEMERRMLAGPTDDEADKLRLDGRYNPGAARSTAERRAEQERELARRLDGEPRWRRGRITDVVGAHELIVEEIDMITEQMIIRGTTIGALVGEDRQTMRAFAQSMPGTAVAIAIKSHYHRDGNRRWTLNDVHDIDALALAVPYCDAVFTDASARNALIGASLDARMETVLPRLPNDLIDWLESAA